jgi:hypothetical protein
LKINRKIRKNGELFFSAILILALLLVPSMSCKSEPVTTTLTVTEKSTVTSTAVSTVNNTVTNTTTVTSTVTNTPTTQTSTSKTTTTKTSTTASATTSTTLAYTTGTTSVAWNADGVITEGEYAQMQQMDANYYAYWNTDDEYIYVGVKVKTEGWVGFGVNFNIMSPSEYYIYGDIVFGHFVDGVPVVFDGYAVVTDVWGPDVDYGGNDDIVEWGLTRVDGYTTMEFKKPLDSGDPIYDTAYKPGQSNYVLWLYSDKDRMLGIPKYGKLVTMIL